MDKELEAGRELDELIALKVMGWSEVWFNEGEHDYVGFPPDKIGSKVGTVLPRFSTNIADAWQVAEKLKIGVLPWFENNEDVYIAGYEGPGHIAWYELILYGDTSNVTWAIAKTTPLAICRAALRSIKCE